MVRRHPKAVSKAEDILPVSGYRVFPIGLRDDGVLLLRHSYKNAYISLYTGQ